MTAESTGSEADGRAGEAGLAIREVAAATGISPATLRVWERRYGRPVPRRLPSGHRRYSLGQVRWLRRVSEALSLGHAPAEVVTAGPQRLDALLRSSARTDDGASSPESAQAVEAALGHVADLAAGPLASVLEDAARDTHDALTFVHEVLAPLMRAVGRRWADGRIEVRHEHVASAAIAEVLTLERQRLPPPAFGPPLVLATLPDEHHVLGLHMAALVCRDLSVRSTLLGAHTPLADIAAATRETAAPGVLIATSPSSAGVGNDRVLADLRGRLPSATWLWVGGDVGRAGRRGPRGVLFLRDLPELADRLGREIAAGRLPSRPTSVRRPRNLC